MLPQRTVLAVVVALSMAALHPGAVAEAQFRKNFRIIEVDLNRKRPPKIVITGTAIKVEVVSQAGGRENVAERYRTALETQLLANDTRLHTEQAQPETVISCTISRLDTSQTAGQRQVQVNRQVGTKREWNEKKKAYEDKPNYQLVTETQTFTTVRGSMAAAVQVRDRKSGATLDSQTFSPAYSHEFPAGTTPPESSVVEQWLIDQSVLQVVQRLTPTREPVKVMLARPNDKIDDINKLGQAGLWSRMLEQLELVKPLPDPKREAYRLYNLGVANEAIAYATDDLATSKRLLEQASAQYGRAIEMNAGEKYFREPQTRIAEGIAAYAELDRQQAIIAAAVAKAAATPEPAAEATGARSLTKTEPETGSKAFGNQDVIDLVAGGLDEANLLAAIKDAKEIAFDLTPGGLKQLLSGKVSNRIIAAMRARQTPPPKTGPAKRAAPKSPPTAAPEPGKSGPTPPKKPGA